MPRTPVLLCPPDLTLPSARPASLTGIARGQAETEGIRTMTIPAGTIPAGTIPAGSARAASAAALQQLDQGDDQPALGDQRAEHPFQETGLDPREVGPGLLPQSFDVGLEPGLDPGEVGPGLLPQGFDVGLEPGLDPGEVGLDRRDIGLGGEIGVEQGDMLLGQGLGLPLGEAALGQALDEAVGVEGDGVFGHAPSIGRARPAGKARRAGSPWRRLALLPVLALLLGALGLFAAAPAAAQITVWSATLTVQSYNLNTGLAVLGCRHPIQLSNAYLCSGVLTDDDFSFEGVSYSVLTLEDLPAVNQVWFALGRSIRNDLLPRDIWRYGTLVIGSRSFRLQDAAISNIGGSPDGAIDNLAKWTTTTRLGWSAGDQIPVKLVYNAPPPTSLTLSATDTAPREGGGPVTVTATLDEPAPDGLQVNVLLRGTATWREGNWPGARPHVESPPGTPRGDGSQALAAGADYWTPAPAGVERGFWFGEASASSVQAGALLKIPAGQRSASFEVHILDDTHNDDGETIEIEAQAYHNISYTASVNQHQHALCPSGTCQVPASWMKHLTGVSDELTLTIRNHENAETEAARLAAEAAAEAERQRLAALRAAAGGPLSGLALTAGSQAVALVPAFSPGVTRYRAEVPLGTARVTLAPSWGAEAELGGAPTVLARSGGAATLLAQTQVHASGTAAALALSSAGPTKLEVTVLEPDGSGKRLQGTTTTYRVEVVGAAVPQTAAQTVTVAFSNVPPEHDGQAPFTLDVQSGSKPAVEAFTVTNGTVVRAWSLDPVLWRVRVEPKSWKDVKIAFGGASATVPGPARIRVADARAKEGKDASLDFAVTLSRAASGPVSVDYATKDGTAAAGADYTAASGTLTFAPGETAKTVSVALLDDSIDEGKERFTLRLSNPRGAYLRKMHREAKGVIRNDDPLQAMWLARFGRTVAADAVASVTARLETPRGAGSHLTLMGQRVNFGEAEGAEGKALTDVLTGLARAFGAPSAPANGPDPGDPFARHGLSNGLNDRTAFAPARQPTGRELLLGTSFRMVLDRSAGAQWTGWGQGASVSGFSAAAPGLGLTGESATGSMGMDWESGRLLLGFAMTHSVGEGTARDAGWRYALGSTATMALPYARLRLTDRVSVWGLAGAGKGRLALDLDGGGDGAVAQRYRTDLSMTLVALGGRGDLLTPAEAGGFALALKADAFWVGTKSDRVKDSAFGSLAGARGESGRVRAVLDGSRTFSFASGAALTPSLELGVRHDSGDAETGTGLEVGAGLGWADPSRGLDMALKVHGLAVHAERGYGEWGVSGSLRLVPGNAGRGLSMSLTPSYGADPSGSGRLWALPASAGLAANGAAELSGRFDAEAGYGLALFGGGFTGTPNVGFGLSETARVYRMGWRLTSAVRGDPGFEVSLDATRREAANDNGAEHGVMLRSTIRW